MNIILIAAFSLIGVVLWIFVIFPLLAWSAERAADQDACAVYCDED